MSVERYVAVVSSAFFFFGCASMTPEGPGPGGKADIWGADNRQEASAYPPDPPKRLSHPPPSPSFRISDS